MNEKTIFFQALKESDPAARAAYLDETCATDPQLRARVELLLHKHDYAREFLNQPAWPEALISNASEPKAGTSVGAYKICEQLAEGGMGVVYVAEQVAPVRRKVALKIVKPGMATKDVVARFECERQALAMMDHPNIARVFDGGITENGQPYFVMDLILGVPVTEFCDRRCVAVQDRLELFLKVCWAVHHAHQKGIIHRDIKPGNVLVVERDGVAVPKVIDFGVAKAINQKLSVETVHTQISQMIGTPLYMSPEQATLGVVDVDTRSDVYALGTLLYELLTGTTPFNAETLKQAGFDEMRRIIREEEPTRPSMAVSKLDSRVRSTVEQCRSSAPHILHDSLKGELDWIVMRALEKDPDRRYESARALAADIEHYLSHKPVDACPPSLAYRCRKFVRRNRITVASVAIIAIALLIGSGISIWQAIRANQEASIAQANLRLAVESVNAMYTDVADTSLRTMPGAQELRLGILEKGLNFYLRFVETNADARLGYETAMAWRRVGEGYHRLEQNDKARHALLKAIEMLQDLSSESPADLRYRKELALTYWFLSKVSEVQGRSGDGETYCRMAIEIQSDLAADYPEEPDYLAALAVSYHELGHLLEDPVKSMESFTTSNDLFEQSLADSPNNASYERQLAHNYAHLGRLFHQTDQFADAQDWYNRSIDLLHKAGGPQHADVVDSYTAILAQAYRNWGVLFRDTGKHEQAESAHRQAVQLAEQIQRDFPTVVYYQHELGLSQLELGHTLAAANLPESEEAYKAAYTVFDALAKQFPANPNYTRGLHISRQRMQRGGVESAEDVPLRQNGTDLMAD